MPNAFFIDETYLKDNAPLSGNNDISELYVHAKRAEDTYIQIAIGGSLYNRLKDSLIAGNTTADETTLIKLIRDCLVWYICYDALPFLNFKLRNIGVIAQTTDKSETADRADVTYLRKSCKDTGDLYLQLLQNYLCENSEKFDEYRCSGWGCSEISPNSNVSNTSDLAIDMNDYDNQRIDYNFAKKYFNGR